MGDLISRQAAIDAICEDNEWLEVQRCADITLAERRWRDVDILSVLPDAEPERKIGKWIRNNNGTYSCNKCNSWIPEEQHYYARYCLYCGADMSS